MKLLSSKVIFKASITKTFSMNLSYLSNKVIQSVTIALISYHWQTVLSWFSIYEQTKGAIFLKLFWGYNCKSQYLMIEFSLVIFNLSVPTVVKTKWKCFNNCKISFCLSVCLYLAFSIHVSIYDICLLSYRTIVHKQEDFYPLFFNKECFCFLLFLFFLFHFFFLFDF